MGLGSSNGALLLEFHPPPGRWINWVSLHPGGRFVTETKSLKEDKLRSDLWDISKPASAPRWIATLAEGYYFNEISLDGRFLAKSELNRIVVHDALTGAERHSLGEGTRDGLEWHVDFSADSHTLMARSPRRVEFWDLATGALAASQKFDDTIKLNRTWTSPDGLTMGINKPEGMIELWNRKTGVTRTIRPDTVVGQHEFSVRCSADGRHLAVFGRVGNQDWGPLQVWDVATASLTATCNVDRLSIYHNAFTADQRHLI